MIKKFGASDVHQNEEGKGTHVVSFNIWLCDTEDDVPNLPDKEKTAIGSMALIMDTGTTYFLMSTGWSKFGGLA